MYQTKYLQFSDLNCFSYFFSRLFVMLRLHLSCITKKIWTFLWNLMSMTYLQESLDLGSCRPFILKIPGTKLYPSARVVQQHWILMYSCTIMGISSPCWMPVPQWSTWEGWFCGMLGRRRGHTPRVKSVSRCCSSSCIFQSWISGISDFSCRKILDI